MAQKAKRFIIAAVGTSSEREIYNLNSFFPTIHDYYRQQHDATLQEGPLISILLPTYNTPEAYLRECIESIIIQSYPRWELCIADDNSKDKQVVRIIKEYQEQDDRIKLIERPVNGHISEATNSALTLASGEFVGLMDHDDTLWPNALYEIVCVIHENKTVDFIYSDEDKIDSTGKLHSYPFLKPDFSPEFLESCNYITHFSCIRRTVMESAGGFRKGYEGAQDWDLFIRITEKTDAIVHIPKLLYSWRIHEASTASDTDSKPYVYEAQKKLLEDHLARSGRKGVIETGIIPQHRTVKYDIEKAVSVRVIINVHDMESSLRLLSSFASQAAGLPFDILYVYTTDISSSEKHALEAIQSTARKDFLQLNHAKTPSMYKTAAQQSEADYLIYMEDTVSVISENWAKLLVADCQLDGVGVVGPVLLDETGKTVYSAGIGVGYGSDGVSDMLQGMPFDDPHYSRGLYAKSRRNVSALNGAFFAVSRKNMLQLAQPHTALEICLELLRKGYRHIYTPYVQAVLHSPSADRTSMTMSGTEDRYLNPNFNHGNSRMEVKA
jgi:glycosyltransferase involved in cell wall biosynthesis